MSWELHRHDARHLSELLEPESVDLIVTSPPYFALRSYRDTVHSVVHPDGTVEAFQEHYDGQLGSEATPGEFIDNLIACTADWLKVLKPTGSLWVNLSDKYAGSGGHNNGAYGVSGLHKDRPTSPTRDAGKDTGTIQATRRNAPDRYNQSSDVASREAERRGIGDKAMREDDGLKRISVAGIKDKSRMGLPWRYALRCIDELGLILRADIIWAKPNGLPESVTDRVRISHEYLFHFVRQGRYYASIDEIREEYPAATLARYQADYVKGGLKVKTDHAPDWIDDRVAGPTKIDANHLGKVPGSVWTIPSEPLQVPDHLGVDHFAAYPSELVRRIILGWTPNGYCTACGEARRAVVDKMTPELHEWAQTQARHASATMSGGVGKVTLGIPAEDRERTITGYACACWSSPGSRLIHTGATEAPPTRPAVVADPFVGTGTTAAVAHHLGRHGIGTDLSNDYLRLAEWRCNHDHRLRDKVLERAGLPAAPKIDGQLDLFGTPT